MKTRKKALLFALCLMPVSLIGGWLSTEMSISSMEPSMLEAAVQQAGSMNVLKAVSILQIVFITFVCGFFGYILAVKTGLMRPFGLKNPPLVRALLLASLGGAVLSLDAWTFGSWIPELKESYASAGSFDAGVWVSSVLYGGVIEEVMLRLFLMSGLALIGWKLFFKTEVQGPEKVLIAANILSAVAFAAAHLPATAMTFGKLTVLLILRCFLLNGAAGLLFGRFYRKYGIQYAMLSHMLFHLVSRTIWLIAIP